MQSVENQLLSKATEFSESFEGLQGWQCPVPSDVCSSPDSKNSEQ